MLSWALAAAATAAAVKGVGWGWNRRRLPLRAGQRLWSVTCSLPVVVGVPRVVGPLVSGSPGPAPPVAPRMVASCRMHVHSRYREWLLTRFLETDGNGHGDVFV